MPGTVIGLDIGARSIKAAVLKGTFRGYEVEDFLSLAVAIPTAEVPAISPAAQVAADSSGGDEAGETLPEPVHAGAPSWQLTVTERARSEAIESVLRTAGHDAATIVAAVPASRASTWLIDLPFSDKKRIEQTIDFEVENYVPWDLEDVVLDWAIIESDEGARILTAMVPRDRLRRVLDVLIEGGAEPRHVGIDALELARLAHPEEQEGQVILDIGATRTLVCVVREGRPRWTRSMDLGADSFPGVVEQQLEDGRVVEAWPEPRLWAASLRATLLAAEESGAPPLDRLLLTGGGSRRPGLAESLEADLGIPVEELVLPPSQVNEDVAPRPEPEHALAYALALRAFVEKKDVAIEFRRGEFNYKAASRATARLIAAAVAAVLLLCVGYVGNHMLKMRSLHNQLDDATAGLVDTVQGAFPAVSGAALSTADGSVAVMREQVTGLQYRVEALSGFDLTTLSALKELSDAIPATILVDLDEYLVNDEVIRVRGVTDSFKSVDDIEAAVLAKPEFPGAKKSDVSKGRDDKMKFVVTVPRIFEDEETDG